MNKYEEVDFPDLSVSRPDRDIQHLCLSWKAAKERTVKKALHPSHGSSFKGTQKNPLTKPSGDPAVKAEVLRQANDISIAKELLHLQPSCGARGKASQKLSKTLSFHPSTYSPRSKHPANPLKLRVLFSGIQFPLHHDPEKGEANCPSQPRPNPHTFAQRSVQTHSKTLLSQPTN